MRKTILFVILDKYADWEAAYLSSALAMLCEDKYETKTVSLTKDPVHSIGGFSTQPDYDIESAPEEYEALILIGGMTWRSEEAQKVGPMAERCFNSGRILGGICDASAFLGTLKILNNIKHTSNDLNDLQHWAKDAYSGESNYIMEQAVSDNNVITANGTAPLEFAREVLLTLKAAPEKKITDWYNFHKLGFYNAPMPEM
ncbi:putative protease YdeA [Clostridiales bacterium]|nr:putative protease YdeA [Clostridiales bacterium]